MHFDHWNDAHSKLFGTNGNARRGRAKGCLESMAADSRSMVELSLAMGCHIGCQRHAGNQSLSSPNIDRTVLPSIDDRDPWVQWHRRKLLDGLELLAGDQCRILRNLVDMAKLPIIRIDERSTARPMFRQYARGSSILLSSLAWCTVFLVVALPIISLVGKAGWVAVQSEGEIQRSWSLPQVVYSMFSLGDFSEEFSWSAQLALLASSIATLSAWILAGLLSKTRLVASIAMGIAIAMAGLPGPIVNLGVKRTLESLPERISDLMLEESLAAPALALQFRCMPLAFLVFYSLWRRWRMKHDQILQLEKPSWWSLQRIVAHGLMRPILAIWITTAAIATADLSTYILVLPPQVSTLAMRIFELLHYGVRYKEAGLCLSLLVIGCTRESLPHDLFKRNGWIANEPKSLDMASPLDHLAMRFRSSCLDPKSNLGSGQKSQGRCQTSRLQSRRRIAENFLGKVITEAQDGGMLLLGTDGRIALVQPEEVISSEDVEDGWSVSSSDQLSAKLKEEFPKTLKFTPRNTICSVTTRPTNMQSGPEHFSSDFTAASISIGAVEAGSCPNRPSRWWSWYSIPKPVI